MGINSTLRAIRILTGTMSNHQRASAHGVALGVSSEEAISQTSDTTMVSTELTVIDHDARYARCRARKKPD
jgi:hypothetical protein